MKIESIEHLFTLLEQHGFEDERFSAKHQIFEIDKSYYQGLKEKAIADLTITENTSDGYHTFKELYDFRMVYNAALFNEWGKTFDYNNLPKYNVHKSLRHNNGELCFGGGWFIVIAMLPTGMISNHYEIKYWDFFKITEYALAQYEYDGHTSNDVFERLKSLIIS
jgi:hypothetical protein